MLHDDVARAAHVEAIIAISISGHRTPAMHDHYSTVTPDEQRRSIGNVVRLFDPRKSGEGSGEGAPASGEETQKATRR